MANRTDPLSLEAHGTNPQYLVDKITRDRIYGTRFWKEQCFGVSADALAALAARSIAWYGPCSGGGRVPSRFLCLLLKMLQLSPGVEVAREFIANAEFK